MKNIYSAFVKAQAGFAPALKTSTNPHFKSRYADLAACVEAVIDSLNANGIGLIQRTFEDASGVTVETVFIHESGECLEGGKLHVPASKQDAQGYGSALSYARRYSLMAACGIAPEDDDGNAASKTAKPAAKARTGVIADVLATTPPLPEEEQEYLKDLARKIKADVAANTSFDLILDRLERDMLDSDQKIFLASNLPSNINNKLKELSLARRATNVQT